MQLESLESRQMLSWTVMMYMAADDKGPAADFTLSRVNQVALEIGRMPATVSLGDVNVVAEIDSVGYPAADPAQLFGGAASARRGLIETNGVPDSVWGTDLGNIDSGNPQTLINFVQWAMANYPADHYALILWGNGEGFEGVCRDDTSGSILSMSDLAQVMDAIPHMDLVGFDAGLMGTVEVASQLRGEADVMVASEADIPPPISPDYPTGYIGWDYSFVTALKAAPTMTAEELGAEIVDTFGTYYGVTVPVGNVTLSAVDVTATGRFDHRAGRRVGRLLRRHVDHGDPIRLGCAGRGPKPGDPIRRRQPRCGRHDDAFRDGGGRRRGRVAALGGPVEVRQRGRFRGHRRPVDLHPEARHGQLVGQLHL